MGVSYLSISAVCTGLSFIGLQWWTVLSIEKLKTDGLVAEDFTQSGNAGHAMELLLGSYATIGLLANFALNIYFLLILCLKTIFFGKLYPSETRKVVERLINYVIYKGTFLPLVVPPTIFQVGMWSTWLTVLCSLKMFQALARDRLEHLNASPSAVPGTYFLVFSVLLVVFSVDLLWIKLCLLIYTTVGSTMFPLLLFEPLSIAFETLQAIVVHGFQLLDIWLHHSAGNSQDCQRSKFFDLSAGGSLWEWKGILIRNLGFSLDMMTLLMALGHYVHIWWLRGMAFQLVDALLFLNIRALLSAIIKRIKGFIKLKRALGTLHGALPDATTEELKLYNDECAICREPMAKAKKLSCKHLFHLACLRSWLDQGLSEIYACPTCRKPLFAGGADESNPYPGEVSNDEQLARQLNSRLNGQNNSINTLPIGVFPNQTQNPLETGAWRGGGLESSWLHTWQNQGADGAGPSTAIRSVGLGRVQRVMRQLASVGETYAQTALEDAASWSLWPMNPSEAASAPDSTHPVPARRTNGLHMRTPSHSSNDNLANILAMAETVQEVLPHIPGDIIFQDLQRTNSVNVTVNNLLQM